MFAMAHSTPPPSPQAWILQAKAAHVAPRLAAQLAEEGIPVLLVKGVATARLLYEDAAQRPISDIDLRIERHCFEAAFDAVRRLGYPIQSRSNAYKNLVFEVEGVPIDLEATIGPPGLCGISVTELLARAKPLSLAGGEVRVPASTDHALIATVNVFKDKVDEASPWAKEDLRRLLGSADFDPIAYVNRAQAAQIAAIAATVLQALSESFGGNEGNIAAALAARLSDPSLSSWLHRRLLATTRGPSTTASRVAARLGSDNAREWPTALTSALAYLREQQKK
jgi:hypothetical protein